MNRRLFLSRMILTLPLVFWAACSKKKEKPSAADIEKLQKGAKDYHASVKFVPEGDPIAKAIGYVERPDSNTPMRVEKEGIAGPDQYCNNCHFYVIEEGKPYGECQLLLGKGAVKPEAWCKSWSPTKKV